MIKAHGTITPGWKGGADTAENRHSSPTDSPAHPTLLHPCGCAWKIPGELHRHQEFPFSSARRLHFFQHRSTEVSHSLTGGMLSSASFSSPGSTMAPISCWSDDSQNTSLATPLWFYTVRLTSLGNYPTEQQRKSWQEFALLLKTSFSLTVNPSLPSDLKRAAPLLYIPTLPAQFHTWLLILQTSKLLPYLPMTKYFALVLRKAFMRKHI